MKQLMGSERPRTDERQFRSVAEDFATAMAGVRIPPDVLAIARKERDAFRARNSGH